MFKKSATAGSAEGDFSAPRDEQEPAAAGRPQSASQQGEGTVDVSEGPVGAGKQPGDRSPPAKGSVLASRGAPGPTVAALRQLASDVGNDFTIVDQFVADYLGLLDQRLTGLARLLQGGQDVETIRVWILSLETASAMIGAHDVVAAARELRKAIGDQRSVVDSAYAQLQLAVEEVQSSLTDLGFSAQPQCRSAVAE